MKSQSHIIEQMKDIKETYGYYLGFEKAIQEDKDREKKVDEKHIEHGDEFLKTLEITNQFIQTYHNPVPK